MDYKVPASYCVQCGDLKKLCRCKPTVEKEREADVLANPQQENGGINDKVDNSLVVSDKFRTVREQANTETPETNQRYVSRTREVFKELENSNLSPLSSKSDLVTCHTRSEDVKISETISHSVYETFGVRLRSKSTTNEKATVTPERNTSLDGKCTEGTDLHSVSNVDESSKQNSRYLSDAIASKLAIFDTHEHPESNILQKIPSNITKGMTCVICKRSVHPVERFLGPKGEVYHTNCLRCGVCKCLLDSSCLNCAENGFLCNKCFVKKPRSTSKVSSGHVK